MWKQLIPARVRRWRPWLIPLGGAVCACAGAEPSSLTGARAEALLFCDITGEIAEACLDATATVPIIADVAVAPGLTASTTYGARLAPTSGGMHAGALTFTPPSTGRYSLFLGTPNLPVVLRDGLGEPVQADCIDSRVKLVCTRLRRSVTFSLLANETYRLELGPTAVQTWVRLAFVPESAATDLSSRSMKLQGDPALHDEFGQALAISGARLAVGTRTATRARGEVLVFRSEPGGWVEEARVTQATWNSPSYFGLSVALDTDTLVVGAPYDDTTSTDQDRGAVYVYRRIGASWIEEARLLAPNAERGDYFGHRVAIDGDTLVASAVGEDATSSADPSDNGRVDSGAAYVFTRSGGTWLFDSYLKASNADRGDAFGVSVDVHSDTVVVGAHREDSSAIGTGSSIRDNGRTDSGAVYVFDRTASGFVATEYLKASNPDAGDAFGASLSFDGSWLVVGAPSEASAGRGVDAAQSDNSATRSGAAYAFARDTGLFEQRAYLKPLNAGPDQLFGSSVSMRGGVLAVGADTESSSGSTLDPMPHTTDAPTSGAVYVFRYGERRWSQDAFLKADPVLGHRVWGRTVAASPDWVAGRAGPSATAPAPLRAGMVTTFEL